MTAQVTHITMLFSPENVDFLDVTNNNRRSIFSFFLLWNSHPITPSHCSQWKGKSGGGGVGGGGYSKSLIRGGSAPRSKTVPLHKLFLTETRYPFRIPSNDKWYPLYMPNLERCIRFNFCKSLKHKQITLKNVSSTSSQWVMKCIC